MRPRRQAGVLALILATLLACLSVCLSTSTVTVHVLHEEGLKFGSGNGGLAGGISKG